MTTPLSLLHTHTIPQAHDELLSLRQQLSSRQADLAAQLQQHYGTLLATAGEVSSLHASLCTVDAAFRDLCFADDRFQVARLPTASLDNTTPTPPSPTAISPTASPALLLSRWTLAVAAFTQRGPGRAPLNATVFAELLHRTREVAMHSTAWSGTAYSSIIQRHTHSLQSHIVESIRAHNSALPLPQCIQLFHLLHDADAAALPWDAGLTAQFDTLLFDTLMQRGTYAAGADAEEADPEVREFLQSPVCTDNIAQRLQAAVEQGLTQLREGNDTDGGEEDADSESESEGAEDIAGLVAAAQMQARGLTDPAAVRRFRAVEQLRAQIAALHALRPAAAQPLRAALDAWLKGVEAEGDGRPVITPHDITSDEAVRHCVARHAAAAQRALVARQRRALEAMETLEQ
ncbi:Golgi transport complex subunit [Maudiozyma humilis]|uniref:Golgi transport complex subunit n=1 Tax=Maudiozyma humilis TaxID=51915 RepID=A0AAV5RS30_MAUHU|nr:Golgi transport complex subunit [Kazachstania humilis]